MLDLLPTRKYAAELAGKNQDTITAWSKGGGLVGQLPALAAVAAEAGVSLDWLVFGRRPVPVKGLAECGIAGWYQEMPLGLMASAPEALEADPKAVAVVAVGDSMRPAGISPGDLVFCQPGTPQGGDSVLVELVDGTAAIKRWGGRDGDWITLAGWLPPDAGGVQMPYEDRRAASQVAQLMVVAAVRAGALPVPSGGAAEAKAGIATGADADRLYGIAITTALNWLDSANLEMESANLAGLIGRAVAAISAGAEAKTDKELSEEVSRTLDVALSMLKAIQWKPK